MDDARDVLDANERFYRAFHERDADAMDALWARSAPLACIHPGWGPILGRDEVLRSWREILANPETPIVECDAPEVTLLGDVAHVICVERVELPGEDGTALFIATNLFAREDGAWRLVHHQASPLSDDRADVEPTPPRLLN